MNRNFWILFACLMIAGCSIEDGMDYGDACEGWTALINQAGIQCRGDKCSMDDKTALRNGFCPKDYVCTYDADKNRVCRTLCDETSVLCNDKCITKDEFEHSMQYTLIEGVNYCETKENPQKCPASCVNGCDEAGDCIQSEGCVNGNAEDGSCKCQDECSDLCDETGKCICQDGESVCVDENEIKKCQNHRWVNEKCQDGCVDNACVQHVCSNDEQRCNPDDTDEKELQICKDNTWEKKEDCKNKCLNEKCLDAYEITTSAESVRIFSGKTETVVVNYYVNGEMSTGNVLNVLSADSTCVSVENSLTVNGGTALTLTAGSKSCETKIELRDSSKNAATVSISVQVFGTDEDNNKNHMLDLYETAPKQGEDCRKYSDCDTEQGKGDGFCDSLIGYKCSTKCTKDEECTGEGKYKDIKYQYVCRSDGRCAPDAFITEWDIIEYTNYMLHEYSPGKAKCNYQVDWGDGTDIQQIDKCEDGNTHQYKEPGTYIIVVKGEINEFKSNSRLRKIVTFGPVGLAPNAFSYGQFIENIKLELPEDDIPDATKLNSLDALFMNLNINMSLNHWDVSHVTDMSSMFGGARAFNGDISGWDVSKVTNVGGMFSGAVAFNGDISGWDVSHVTNMDAMFSGARAFKGDISKWDVSNVTNMSRMFRSASAFNGDISGWDVSNVTNMSGMFMEADSFNINISGWNVSKVSDFSDMFHDANSFNQDLSGWNVSSVAILGKMFEESGYSDENLCKIAEKWAPIFGSTAQALISRFLDTDIVTCK